MKVNIRFTTNDGESTHVSELFAVMEPEAHNGCRLVYVEDLSGQKHMTKSTIVAGNRTMRVTKHGEILSDFIYEKDLVHNTIYTTGYGEIPVTLFTKDYSYEVRDDGSISIYTNYTLAMNDGAAPIPMELSILVTPIK